MDSGQKEKEVPQTQSKQTSKKIKVYVKKITNLIQLKKRLIGLNFCIIYRSRRDYVIAALERLLKDLDEDLLVKNFPDLAKEINIKVLLENLIKESCPRYFKENFRKKKFLRWCECKNATMNCRIILILYQLNEILQKIHDKNAIFVHTEFGEAGCKQSYLFTLGLIKLGYKNIRLNLIGKDEWLFCYCKLMREKLLQYKSKVEIVLYKDKEDCLKEIKEGISQKSHSFAMIDKEYLEQQLDKNGTNFDNFNCLKIKDKKIFIRIYLKRYDYPKIYVTCKKTTKSKIVQEINNIFKKTLKSFPFEGQDKKNFFEIIEKIAKNCGWKSTYYEDKYEMDNNFYELIKMSKSDDSPVIYTLHDNRIERYQQTYLSKNRKVILE